MPKNPPAHLLPRGRPTKCRREYWEQIVELMGEGLSITAAAAELGLTREIGLAAR